MKFSRVFLLYRKYRTALKYEVVIPIEQKALRAMRTSRNGRQP